MLDNDGGASIQTAILVIQLASEMDNNEGKLIHLNNMRESKYKNGAEMSALVSAQHSKQLGQNDSFRAVNTTLSMYVFSHPQN